VDIGSESLEFFFIGNAKMLLLVDNQKRQVTKADIAA